MRDRDLSGMLEPLNETAQQTLLPILFGVPVNTSYKYSAEKGVNVVDDVYAQFREAKYHCLIYDNNGFELGKGKITSELFQGMKPELLELPPKFVREAESKFNLGQICNVRFSKYKGPFKLEMCFGEDEEDSIHVKAKSDTEIFQNYALEKEFIIGKPKFRHTFVDIEPDCLDFATPNPLLKEYDGQLDFYRINRKGEVTPRNPKSSDDGHSLERLEFGIGPHVKNILPKVGDLLRGFDEKDYFKVFIHHEPYFIKGKVCYYWQDKDSKLRSDLGTKETAIKTKVGDFISKLSGIESAVKAAYGGILKAPSPDEDEAGELVHT